MVRQLYGQLIKDGFRVWLDEEELLPGQEWETEITKAVRNSNIVIICLSRESLTKSGYIHKEIRFALDVAEEKSDGVIFIIPARLEECEVPDKLKRWQWVDLYKQNGYQRLLLSLKTNLSQQDKTSEYAKETGTRIQSGLANIPTIFIPLPEAEKFNRIPQQLRISLRPTGNGESDKKRIKTIYGTLISFHGRDRFAFEVFENGARHLIEFPNDTTRIGVELITRLKKFSVSEHDLKIEQFNDGE